MRIASFTSALLVLAGVAAGCAAVVTQPWVQAVKSPPPEVDVKRLEVHVKHLSVNLYPRSHDQYRHMDLAARYILAELKAAGGLVTIQDVTVQGIKPPKVVDAGQKLAVGFASSNWRDVRDR